MFVNTCACPFQGKRGGAKRCIRFAASKPKVWSGNGHQITTPGTDAGPAWLGLRLISWFGQLGAGRRARRGTSQASQRDMRPASDLKRDHDLWREPHSERRNGFQDGDGYAGYVVRDRQPETQDGEAKRQSRGETIK